MKKNNKFIYLQKLLSNKRVVTNIIVYVVILFILTYSYIFPPVNLKIGDISTKTIYSDKNIVIETQEDINKTEELKKERASLVENVYAKNDEISKEVKVSLIKLFTNLKLLRNNKAGSVPINNEFISRIDKNTLKKLLIISDDVFNLIEKFVVNVSDVIMERGVVNLSHKNIYKFINLKANENKLPDKYKSIAENIIKNTIKVNLFYDEKATEILREKEKNSVVPIVTRIRKGQPLIYLGDLVTDKHIEIFKKLGLIGIEGNVLGIIGVSLYILLLLFIFDRFIYIFRKKYYEQDKIWTLLGSLFVITLVFADFLTSSIASNFIFEPLLLLPLAATIMLISILVDPIIALLSGIILTLIIGLMQNFNYDLIVFLFITSAIAIFTTYKVEKRNDIISAGFILALFNFLSMFFLDLIKGQGILVWLLTLLLSALVNGIISSMLVLAILPYLENIFNIPTNMKLNEIGNPNHPLLRKLMLKAPGTYYHSIMVANLAETAAENIGANIYISRAGGYFHDIGKIKKPNFFIENEIPGENPHYKLNPQISAMIIMSHVKEGLELARKYNLPKIILDLIEEHHGTSIVSFFYKKMVKDEKPLEKEFNGDERFVDEEKEIFRYEGKRPKSKEAGILMLSDVVEAAVKSVEKPNINKVENIIKTIIQDKIEEGQLDDCPLSLKDIEIIRNSFVKTFSGMFHKRIEYNGEKNKNR